MSPKKGGTGGIDPNSLVKLWIFGGGEPNLGAVARGWIEVVDFVCLESGDRSAPDVPAKPSCHVEDSSFHLDDFDAPSCHVEEPLRKNAHSLDIDTWKYLQPERQKRRTIIQSLDNPYRRTPITEIMHCVDIYYIFTLKATLAEGSIFFLLTYALLLY